MYLEMKLNQGKLDRCVLYLRLTKNCTNNVFKGKTGKWQGIAIIFRNGNAWLSATAGFF